MEDKLEWLRERQKGIGGSDVGAIMGVSQYKTAFNIYLEKTEPIIELEKQSEAAYWGDQFEEVVAKEFERRTGKKVRRDRRHFQNKDYPFMVANIDRRVVGEDAILECKTANQYLAKEWESEEVPPSYLLQVQHYLAVTGASKGYIAVLIGGQKFIWKEIERDEELINIIIEAEKEFWKMVQDKTPPALDGSSAAEKWVNEKYKNVNEGETINLDSSWRELLNQRQELKEYRDDVDKQIKEIENQLKQNIKNAEYANAPGYNISYKSVSQKRLDSSKLKALLKDEYADYLKETTSRRLVIKEEK
ncbi:YqaJ viral recombinase family protein [Clostridium perfringens]|uniref:YqaJ viral recombinase family nuclease n=1 Tax=Clostridium perfringens TaxID=1502 RepID=UPI001ABA2D4F|nr:YqaJ viral recombinase family protein [Clostridium perfringens]MBO3326445.1 YqaJ viral recombinase family protein [Clostridium perfringens]